MNRRALLTLAILVTALPAAAGDGLAGSAQVLDGVTIVVEGIHVWLKGVTAPEVAHYDEPGKPNTSRRAGCQGCENTTVIWSKLTLTPMAVNALIGI